MNQSNMPSAAGPGGPADLDNDIAIVGLACRFAGARDASEYWANLRDGVESVTPLTKDELSAAGVSPALFNAPNYVPVGAEMPDLEMFDATLFGLSPRDAAIMDPQHRHFLQCAWAALEDAGHVPDRFPGAIGVFAGSGQNVYFPYHVLSNPDLLRNVGFFLLRHTGNDKDFLTTRVSYLLDLKGPSVNIQTACSSSLVAIHMAVQSLLGGESDMALAGGVTIELLNRYGYLHEEGEVLSPDGHCRAFDAQSAGTVFGSGAGVVVLRRLQDAIDDGDHIYAVVKGSAINNDGVGKVSYLAPSVDGQARVVREALAVANVDAASVGYVEMHGTGTLVGDPIEVAALTQAFRQDTQDKGFCAIGSVKPNIGHTDTAAGVAGVIKVAMAMKQGELPPSLNYSAPNPACDFEATPFFVNDALRPWPRRPHAPRRAGVTSLGVGGTNAHVVMEEAPPRTASGLSRRPQLLLLSAASQGALDANGRALGDHLASPAAPSLADAAYTLSVGRKALRHRRVLVAESAADARALLADPDAPGSHGGESAPADRPVAFLFAGGGAQYPGMAADLYRSEPVFGAALDSCLTLLAQGGVDLRPHLLPEAPGSRDALDRPSLALPALFSIQYAMARLWMSWGVRPAAMIGHSMGEYTAAHLAGVFDLPSALRLVAGRGRLFETLAPGAMLSVPLAEDALLPLLESGLGIAAVNGRRLTVASGPIDAIERLETLLAEREISAQRVPISVAAHSAMLEPILDEFRALLATVPMRAPTLRFISNLTGDWIKPGEATDPEYWVRHLRRTVRFDDGLSRLLAEEGGHALLEVGPGRTLASLARQHPGRAADQPVLNSLRHAEEEADDQHYALTVLGRLWVSGVPVDWDAYWKEEQRLRVPLPSYRFDPQRHWIEPGNAPLQANVAGPGTKDDPDSWFHAPIWRRTPPLAGTPETGTVLIFLDARGAAMAIADRLREQGVRVVTVRPGQRFSSEGEDAYRIDPARAEDYRALLARLALADAAPDRIVHAALMTGKVEPGTDRLLRDGFYSLLFLAQALGEEMPDRAITMAVLSDFMQRVMDEATLMPAKAAALGLCTVMPSELTQVSVRSIDIDAQPLAQLADAIIAELSATDSAEAVAYRGGERWVQGVEPMPLAQTDRSPTRLRPGGSYVITGGLGGIGLTLARHLAQNLGARVALVGRSALPPRGQWAHCLAVAGPDAARIRDVMAIEALGSEVLLLRADVTDRRAMRRVFAEVRRRFGAIHGVFHTAGTLNDGPLQLRNRADAAEILAPKVQGTLAIDAALAGHKADFLMLFSSVSAFAGAPGQADYAAANAFLDAFAQARRGAATRVLSVGWSQWADVGMAAAMEDALGAARGPATQDTPIDHPLLDRLIHVDAEERVYSARLSPDRHWLLDEHRLASGEALIPGTGHLELIRAAFHDATGAAAMELRDVMFLSPFAVEDGSERELRIHLRRRGDDWRYTLLGAAEQGAWVEHSRGIAATLDLPPAATADLDMLRARCPAPAISAGSSAAHMRFGPRWNSIRGLSLGDGEALLDLELPSEFAGDLDHVHLHPALLDFATAGAQLLVPGFDAAHDFYVPASYGRLRQVAPLASRIVSHVRHRRDGAGVDGMAVYDVVLHAPDGTLLCEIEGFTMLRVQGPLLLAPAPSARPQPKRAPASSPAMLPAQGMDVIERILAAQAGPHVIIAMEDIDALVARLRRPVRAIGASSAAAGEDAPRTAAELMIAELWSDLLGVETIGRSDDFFELGGHSLLAVQLINRIRKLSGKALPLTALLEAPTVAQLAALVDPDSVDPDSREPASAGDLSAAGPAIPGLISLRPGEGGPPLFIVHDGLGETLLYRTLALALDPRHAVYGLQPEMRADGGFAHTRIDEMASAYIARIRRVQPHGPYVLAGLCAGGVIAFEMARQLEDAGEAVHFVGIIDAADVEAAERPFYVTRSRILRVREALRGTPWQVAAVLLRKVWNAAAYEVAHRLEDRRRAHAVDVMQARDAQPQAAEQLSFLQLYEVAHRRHRPQGLFSCGDVVLFRATQGNGAADDIPFFEQYGDTALGWRRRVADDVAVIPVPGGHVSALQEPHVAVLATALQARIDQALEAHSVTPQAAQDPPPDAVLGALPADAREALAS